jgi:hypothetical protein
VSFLEQIFGRKKAEPLKTRQLEMCQQFWFNPHSAHDQKLTLHHDNKRPVEVDSLEVLRLAQVEPSFHELNEFVVYQHWGPEVANLNGTTSRLFKGLEDFESEELGKILNGGPTRRLVIVATTFSPNSIRRLAEVLLPDQLETLGLCWFFSGDSILDRPQDRQDIIFAANRLNIKRLSILTGEFDVECEEILASGLKDNKMLEAVGIFGKDDNQTWPRYPTPRLDAIFAKNADIGKA